MKKPIVGLAGVAALAVPVVASAAVRAGAGIVGNTAQVASGRTLMACLNERTADGNVFRRTPRTCGVHFANKPFDGDDIAPVTAIRWLGWGAQVASGHGTFRGNMNYTAPGTVVVRRPRLCSNGSRDYAWASVTTRGIGTFSGPLAACHR